MRPAHPAAYTNTGFVVLSAVIEEATGKPYEAYCRDAVFARLGIASARLHPDWRQFSGARGWIITPRTTSPSSTCSTRSIRFSATA